MDPYDIKLKEAMEAIKKIMDDYEIGGSVILVSKTHSEFMYKFPLWTGITISDEGEPHIDFQKKSYDSKEAQNETIDLTVHALLQMRDISGRNFMTFEKINESITEHMPKNSIEHEPFSKFHPHDPDYGKGNCN